MQIKSRWTILCILAYFGCTSLQATAKPAVEDPCAGPTALLSLIDRPTVSDSACVVPPKHLVLETGFQAQDLTPAGHAQNIPEAELRLGLPAHNEFVLLLPNYIHQSVKPHSGFTAATVGLKHELGYTQHWLGAVEGLVTLPVGSDAFGSEGTGGAFNGIVTYTFNPQWNVSFMFGVSSETQSKDDGGQRFTSWNPDWVITYAPAKKVALYAEFYGQSKSGPGEGSGYNFDGGIIYLLTPKITVDLEVGHRLSGNLGGFAHYLGAGVGIFV